MHLADGVFASQFKRKDQKRKRRKKAYNVPEVESIAEGAAYLLLDSEVMWFKSIITQDRSLPPFNPNYDG